MAAKLITPPALEPVTLALAKLHCREVASVQDDLLTMHITTARQHCEDITGARAITQTWELRLDAFPDGAFTLPGYPLQSVTSIEYLDENGDPQDVDPSTLVVDTFSRPGSVSCSNPWPATQDTINAVQVRYVLGFGDAAEAVPAAFRSAILLVVGDLFENRQGQQKDPLNGNPAVDHLLWPYRLLTP